MVDLPATQWRPQSGIGEYSGGSSADIVNNTGVFLVDKDGNNVVDTGVVYNRLPATEWVQSEGS